MNSRVFFALLALIFISPCWADTEALRNKSKVLYDIRSDLISIDADRASLKTVLGQITMQTGIQTTLDPDANIEVSLHTDTIPLESALKQLLKGTDHVLIYGDASTAEKPLILRIEVLKAGQDKAVGINPIIDMLTEANIQARRYPVPEIFNLAQKRWQERMSKLPPDQRQVIESRYNERMALMKKRLERREKRRKDRENRKNERETKRQAKDERLKKENPELYEYRMRERELIRQKHQPQ